ncbi:homeobox protein siamois-like [Pelobates fuscus]|uniref:homeobox protein siamois-like n=1 Tax=Pelobates fuscus TaxID=191477 RepID=UPI002FE4EA77
MDIDVELNQILTTVLSLEEDYPLPRNEYKKDGFTCVLGELPDIFQSVQSRLPHFYSGLLQQNHEDPCSLLRISHETKTNQTLDPKDQDDYINKSQGTYKGNKRPCHAEQTEGCKRQRCMNDIYLPMASNSRTVKRTQFSMEQTAYLLNQFELDPYPDFVRRCQIANLSGIPEPRIQVWFQNRRARHLMEPRTTRSNLESH